MLTKEQKIKLVKEKSKELKDYKIIGVIHLDGKPDRLLQSSRNRLKQEVKILTGKKSLLTRILESDERTKSLSKELKGTSAILLANGDPFEIYKKFSSNSIKLAAKPKQVAPEDIWIKEGETGVAPGQGVTELKQAGIDVQIQKGKVVIAKDKVLVKKGSVISLAVAKALHTLNVTPFEASIVPEMLLWDKVLMHSSLLDISPERTMQDITSGFRNAITVAFELGIVNQYTVLPLISKAYSNAICLGTSVNAYDTGIIELVISKAAAQAAALGEAMPQAQT
jgi:large subunit ribosomal protein L10